MFRGSRFQDLKGLILPAVISYYDFILRRRNWHINQGFAVFFHFDFHPEESTT